MEFSYILIILYVILFLFILYKDYYNINYKYEYFNPHIYFLNKHQAIDILKNDYDNYFNKLFKKDYIARNIDNINQYYIMIDKSVNEFNKYEQNKLTRCINMANDYIQNINYKWFDGNKCALIPWKIICIEGKLYEYGLPHTRGEYIILSKKDVNDYTENKLTKTLIHEKVHVYQKMYINDTDKYVIDNGFIKWKIREEKDNIRANPDIDNWIYKDKGGNIYKAEYNNDKPKAIDDITYKPYTSQSYEHPFEKMAIFIENNYHTS